MLKKLQKNQGKMAKVNKNLFREISELRIHSAKIDLPYFCRYGKGGFRYWNIKNGNSRAV